MDKRLPLPYVTIEFFPGPSLAECVESALGRAHAWNVGIIFDYNGVRVPVAPGMSIADVLHHYDSIVKLAHP